MVDRRGRHLAPIHARLLGPAPVRVAAVGNRPAAARRQTIGGANLLIGGVAAVLVIAILGFVVLSGGGGGKDAPTFKASTAVDLKVGATKVEGVNFSKAVEISADAQNKILSALGTYVENAIVEPLRKGKAVDTALVASFDAAAAPKVTGADRAILTDEGLPKAVGEIKVTTPPVRADRALRLRRQHHPRERRSRLPRHVSRREGHHEDPAHRARSCSRRTRAAPGRSPPGRSASIRNGVGVSTATTTPTATPTTTKAPGT